MELPDWIPRWTKVEVHTLMLLFIGVILSIPIYAITKISVYPAVLVICVCYYTYNKNRYSKWDNELLKVPPKQ
jgi:hypothetical protein